jgi:hypothetical protein
MKVRILLALASGALVSSVTPLALADTSTIKMPGAHADYVFEAEPHAVVAPFDEFQPGIGFRGTIEILDNGFVSSINNTVGIGFGADWATKHFRLPIVMQWNFWLSRNWSVFGEPGGVIDLGDKTRVHPAFFAGGRFHFTDRITLTMRVGHPLASVGVSFLL